MKFESILRRYKNNIAIIFGNGIHRFESKDDANSWEALLVKLARSHKVSMPHDLKESGVSLTEFYDVLEVVRAEDSQSSMQVDFSNLLTALQPRDHHRSIVSWAIKNEVPILTTNFDECLAQAGNCAPHSIKNEKKGFTAFYPWGSYYGDRQLMSADAGFGIWHINGMQRYSQSIRLGLSHYMGSVSRAREWLHSRQSNDGLFEGKDQSDWIGSTTWLHLMFNRDLAFCGLELGENEVFLRWLLIERAKYFKKFPDRKRAGWYFYSSKNEKVGKLFFLKGVGIEPVHVPDRAEIYKSPLWVD